MNMVFFYQYSFMQRVPPPLKKPALLKICVSGTVGDPLLMQIPHFTQPYGTPFFLIVTYLRGRSH